VTAARRVLASVRPLRRPAWPVWAFLLFAGLAAVRFLPGYLTRAAVAAPILLLVPGALTLGALFNQRHRPRGWVFAGYAALLSLIWSAFASLALYVTGTLITATSTFWCLLGVCALLAAAAETRLLREPPGNGRRAVRRPDAIDPGQPGVEADDIETPAAVRKTSFYALIAVVAGASLLAGATYVYDRLPGPAPVGYTWLAWTGQPVKGAIQVSSSGTNLTFQIVHHEPDTTAFQLNAVWLGTSSQPLAAPLSFTVGPDQTFHGSLFVPPLANECTYRIVVSLTAARQIDPLTKKAQSWSINADVQGQAKSSKTCKG
jgi:hypothetical protein